MEKCHPELVEGCHPELVEGCHPELVEGSQPELVEGCQPELVEGCQPELVEGRHPEPVEGCRSVRLPRSTAFDPVCRVELHRGAGKLRLTRLRNFELSFSKTKKRKTPFRIPRNGVFFSSPVFLLTT
jgi:hypothetical protein